MTDGAINKVLYNVDQRTNTTDAEKKTARDNIGAIAANEVQTLTDDRYKRLQIPTEFTFAPNAVVNRIQQDAQGVVSLRCSYITPVTEYADGLMSVADKTKLDSIAYGAEQNVQADWTESDVTSDSYILHKPAIPSPQVNSDWTATSGVQEILHKPDLSQYATQTDLAGKQDVLTAGSNITIANNVISASAAPQVNADWTATSGVQEILHKPDLSNYATQADLAGKQDTLTAGSNITITNNVISATASPQLNADWNATSGVQEILHKPDLSQYATQQDLSGKQDTLTAGQNITISNNVISATAAPQVQADWAQSDPSAVDFIKNKPTTKPLVAGTGIILSTGANDITISANETKYWYFDLNGDDTTTWATIGPTNVGDTVHLPIQWDDQGTAGRKQIRTNFTQGDPEAFPYSQGSASQGSAWIVLKKGLWRYTLYVDLEPTTLGTGIAPLQLWMRVMTQGVVNYQTVRRIEMPTNNNVQSMYTRTISGLVYSDIDPTYSGGELDTYRTIHFDFDLNGACDAEYRFRQNALMLERIGV